MISSAPRGLLLIFGLFALDALRGVAEELAAASKEAPVALPAYTVTDSRDLPPPEAWRYSEIPGFEILSNASDRETLRLLKDFQMFNQAVGIVWPALLGRSPVPVSLIICGRGGKFDAFVPKSADAGANQALASLFLRNAEHSAIVVDFEAREIAISGLDTLGGAAAGGVENNGYMEVDAYKQLYREYVHSLLARSTPRMPAWVEEGLAQLLMGMKFDRKNIQFAKLEDPNTLSISQAAAADQNASATDAGDTGAATAAAEDRDFNAALQRRPLMPFPEMFAVTHDSAIARNPLGSNWAKQSCAFVHMCLYGVGQRYQKGFVNFLLRTSTMKEPPTEALFKECFGVSYKSMLIELRGYIDFTNYKSLEWNAKGGGFPEPAPIVLRAATEAEVGRIKGDAFIMAERMDNARVALVAPYARGERDPNLLAALGLYERSAGNDERARKFLEAATAGKVVRPRAYLELARQRYQAALAKPAAPGGRLSLGQTTEIVSLLLPARSQPPAMPEIYELMGDTLVRGVDTPPKDMLQVLFEGVNLFPRRLGIAYQTAVLCLRAGENKGAAGLIEHGLRYSQDEAAKARFTELKASLPPVPAAVPAAKS